MFLKGMVEFERILYISSLLRKPATLFLHYMTSFLLPRSPLWVLFMNIEENLILLPVQWFVHSNTEKLSMLTLLLY